MDGINKRQLDRKAIQLRYSFKCWYNKAKRINSSIIVFSFIISILSVFNILYKLNLNKIITFIGALWIFISMVLKKTANNYRKIGADLQEKFDIYVFRIEKNNAIIMPKTPIENIYSYISEKEQNNLDLYYIGLDSSDKIKNIIIAQRDNIVYDKKMRSTYYYGNIGALIIYLIIFIVLGIKYGLKVEEFLVSIIIPAINIVAYFIDNILMIKSELEILREGELSIGSFFEDLCNNKDIAISELKCREYQDFIYLKRRNWVMIPNYIYWLKQSYKKTRKIVNKQLSSN